MGANIGLGSEVEDYAGNRIVPQANHQKSVPESQYFDADALRNGTLSLRDAWIIATSLDAQNGLESIGDSNKKSGREVARAMAITILKASLAQGRILTEIDELLTATRVSNLAMKILSPKLGELKKINAGVQAMGRKELQNYLTSLLQQNEILH